MNGSGQYQSAMFAVFILSYPASLMSMDESWKSISLPNGDRVELRSVREGNYEWFESRDSFAIVRTSDRYEYAFQDDEGGIVASGVLAGLSGRKLPFPPGIRPTPEFLRRKRAIGGPAGSPPSPHPVSILQPDGSKIELFLKGSSGASWYENKEGFTILSVPGRLEYAIRNPEGALVGSGIAVGSMSPPDAGLKPGVRPSDDFLRRHASPSDR